MANKPVVNGNSKLYAMLIIQLSFTFVQLKAFDHLIQCLKTDGWVTGRLLNL